MKRNLIMKKRLFLILLLGVINLNLNAAKADFTLCKSKFALCTTAPCEPIPGKKGYASCRCNVQEGYSVGTKPCSVVKETSKGQAIHSRYYPIKVYAACTNNRPWAWCLDSPCLIDKNDPAKASCLCSIVKNQGAYILVTEHYDQSTCSTGLYSSATIEQSHQITDFLKNHSELPPFPIKVLNAGDD